MYQELKKATEIVADMKGHFLLPMSTDKPRYSIDEYLQAAKTLFQIVEKIELEKIPYMELDQGDTILETYEDAGVTTFFYITGVEGGFVLVGDAFGSDVESKDISTMPPFTIAQLVVKAVDSCGFSFESMLK